MGRTVTKYLIDGDPNGTQYVVIDDMICKMYVILRSNLSILNDSERPELQTPALYILLGEDETTKPEIYIGQTGNFKERVRVHNNDKGKDFWRKVLLFISQGVPMTATDVQYLEHRAIVEARKVSENSNTFVMDGNKQTPEAPILSEPRKDVLDKFFNDVKFLASFAGYNIFDMGEKKLFYTKGRDGDQTGFYDAKGFYDDANGFTVLKGSTIAKLTVDSYTGGKEKRESLLKDYTESKGDKLILKSDITFPTPSAAASFCCGSNQNGWTFWKDENGQTLDDVYRKPME